MSNQVNTDLLEQASFHLDYWTGTLWEKLIQHAVDTNDLEQLEKLISDSWTEIFNKEYQPDTEVGDVW